MSKHIPVYEKGQWIKKGAMVGRIDAHAADGEGARIYSIQWGKLAQRSNGGVDFEATRKTWIRSDNIAHADYEPCENPVRAPSVYPSQPILPLDIEALNETMARSAVALGKIGADWLRAKGLTV